MDGQTLMITTIDHRRFSAPTIAGQLSFDEPAIAADGRVVGWLALFDNPTTSYPIPLTLVLYSDGRSWSISGEGLAVWKWSFSANGRQVVLRVGPVHGDAGARYELRDTFTARLLAQFEPREGAMLPPWAASVK
jgi:hypothetical protein